MIWGSILQIIGVLLTAFGAILALTKLWEGYFYRSKKWAEINAWLFKEYVTNDDKLREKDIEYLKKVLKSDDFDQEYKAWLTKITKSRIKGSDKTKERMKKNILRQLFLDRYFLQIGVSFIIIGTVTQIIGIVIG